MEPFQGSGAQPEHAVVQLLDKDMQKPQAQSHPRPIKHLDPYRPELRQLAAELRDWPGLQHIRVLGGSWYLLTN